MPAEERDRDRNEEGNKVAKQGDRRERKTEKGYTEEWGVRRLKGSRRAGICKCLREKGEG